MRDCTPNVFAELLMPERREHLLRFVHPESRAIEVRCEQLLRSMTPLLVVEAVENTAFNTVSNYYRNNNLHTTPHIIKIMSLTASMKVLECKYN